MFELYLEEHTDVFVIISNGRIHKFSSSESLLRVKPSNWERITQYDNIRYLSYLGAVEEIAGVMPYLQENYPELLWSSR